MCDTSQAPLQCRMSLPCRTVSILSLDLGLGKRIGSRHCVKAEKTIEPKQQLCLNICGGNPNKYQNINQINQEKKQFN